MRRPHEMRLIKLSRYEYQIIGEIAVLSGMIEQEMKELIVKLVKAPWPDGPLWLPTSIFPAFVISP